jgi:pyrroline-5-carboxylate reductase
MSGISGGSMGSSWKERERAAEELYFSKRDAEALADLARKMHAQATPSAEKVAKDKDALAALFDKYGVKASDELLDEVRILR